MGERCQVSRSAERTLLIDNRKNVVVEHVHEPSDGGKLHSGMTVRERLHLQEQHQFHDFRTYRVSGSAGVGHHQIVLQLRKVLLRNRDVAQRAEACSDTIDRPTDIFHLAVQVLTAFEDLLLRLFRKGYGFIMVNDFFYFP